MKKQLLILITLSSQFLYSHLYSCTAFQLKSTAEDLIYCRSIDCPDTLDSEVLIIGRGESYQGSAGKDKKGLEWKTRYGFVGMNQKMTKLYITDGMNEKGLVASWLYMPGFTQYQTIEEGKIENTLGYWELPTYILSTCSTIQEIKTVLPTLIVGEQPMSGTDQTILPLHFYFSDRNGNTLIVEYVDGKCFQWNNSLGVLTNSPPFAWHLFNLSNYVNLSSKNVESLKLPGIEITNTSQGSGLLGLPGDYTSASRFVKATLFSQWATPSKDALSTVNLGFHILNTFDTFEGIIRGESDPSKNGQQVPIEHNTDITQWSIVHDRTNMKTYIRSYQNLSIEMIDLKKIDFAKVGIKTISQKTEFNPKDITQSAKAIESIEN
jgi:choloylglycine hydrolase